MDAELIKRIDEEIDKARDLVAQDTIALVRINSEQGEPAPDAPFGLGPKKVLDTVLKMGEENGFYCKDYGVGVVSLSLKDRKPDLGIWLHGDVVPAGDGWIYPPYEGVMYKDTHIIGRGATDNKGQLSAIFNILKIFKKLGVDLNYNPALYVGSNEETGMEDVKAFVAKYEPPRMSLVPDSGFPVGYGGKGSIQITFRSKKPLHGLILTAGLPKAPGKANAELNGNTYETESPPRHGANPDPNGNMVTKLMVKLLETGSVHAEDIKVLEFLKDISLDVYGEKFGISVSSTNRKKLGELVFTNRHDEMKILADITWEGMRKIIDNNIELFKDEGIVLDWILLPHTHYFKMCDKKVLVKCPEELRRERVKKRDNINDAELDLRDSASIEYNENDFNEVIMNRGVYVV